MEKINYRLNWQDFKALERYIRSKKFVPRLYFWVQYIAVPLILVGVPLWSVFQYNGSDDRTTVLWRVAPVLGFLPFWVALMVYSRWSLRRKLKLTGIFDHDSAIGLSEAGLWRRDATGEGTTFWNTIKEVRNYRDYIFFVLSVEGAITILPKRSFSSLQAASAFHQEALRLWEKHRG
jgi:hypothetical protein